MNNVQSIRHTVWECKYACGMDSEMSKKSAVWTALPVPKRDSSRAGASTRESGGGKPSERRIMCTCLPACALRAGKRATCLRRVGRGRQAHRQVCWSPSRQSMQLLRWWGM